MRMVAVALYGGLSKEKNLMIMCVSWMTLFIGIFYMYAHRMGTTIESVFNEEFKYVFALI